MELKNSKIFLIKITSNENMKKNFEKTVIKGIQVNNQIKYYWNKACKDMNINDLIWFFSKDYPKIRIYKIKKIGENDDIHEILKKEWNDNEGKYKGYVELEKIQEINYSSDLIEKIFKGQNTCRYFNKIDNKTKQELLNILNNKSSKMNIMFSNLKLEEYIIKSFYNTLKTKGFVILAGISGSGKTKIFEEFVKCFVISDYVLKNNVLKVVEKLKKQNINLLYEKLKKFNQIYTKEFIKNMKLEEWHDNQKGLIYELEFGEFKELGDIRGNTAEKFGIYKKQNGEYWFNPKLGNNLEEAFKKLKDELIELYKFAKNNELEKIETEITHISPMVKRKLAFMWNSNLIFNIFSEEHLKKIISSFNEKCENYIDCQKKLKNIKNKYFNTIDNLLFINILYYEEIKNIWNKGESLLIPFKKINSLFYSIRPDFRDTKSLLGFYNPLKNEYHSTPLLEFILEASKNYLEKGKNADPFFILFDEMNLARVEYYFADFLSILESKRFENKNECFNNEDFKEFVENLKKDINEENFKFTSQSIKLHNENISNIPQQLFLPPNLYFIGTVNIDETTHMFSPKVLDRAFTIEFDVKNFEKYLGFLKENLNNNYGNNNCNFKNDFINNGEFAILDKSKILSFCQQNKEYVKKLDEINDILRKYNLHFGYRVFDEIIMFLYNSVNSQFKFKNLQEAFDLAIKMKILPKFHGTKQQLWNSITELIKNLKVKEKIENKNENDKNNDENNIYSEIENIKNIPLLKESYIEIETEDKIFEIETSYKHTIFKLLEMLYKLKIQGFASFM